MKTRNHRALAAVAAVCCPRGLFPVRRWPQEGRRRRRPRPPPPPPEMPLPVANQRFEINPGDDVVGHGAGREGPKEDTLAGHRAALQRRLRGDRARQSQVDAWLPGEGTRGRRAHAVRPAECAARGPGHQSPGDAHLLLPAGARRARRRWSSRTRSASARWAGAPPRGSPRSRAARRTRPGTCRSRCARSTTRTARTWSR